MDHALRRIVVSNNHGKAARRCFENHLRRPFPRRGKQKYVGLLILVPQLLSAEKAEKRDVLQSLFNDSFLQLGAKHTFAGDSEIGFCETRSGIQHELRLLKRTQRTYKQDSRPGIRPAIPGRSEEIRVYTSWNDLARQTIFTLEACLHELGIAVKVVTAKDRLLPQLHAS